MSARRRAWPRRVLLVIGLGAALWVLFAWRGEVAEPAVGGLTAAAASALPRRIDRPERAQRADAGHGVRGRVSCGGSAVAGARVCGACVSCEASTARAAPCTESNGDGNYVLAGLAQGAYYVHANAEGYLPGTANRGEPVVVGWETVEHVDVELAAGGALLTGAVLDATGGPVAGAHVRAVRALAPMCGRRWHARG
jgi:hypothetical protein